jgi:hypothetical protein
VFVTTKRFEIRELMFKGSPIKFDNELWMWDNSKWPMRY